MKDSPFFDMPNAMLEAVHPDGVLIGTRCPLHTPMALEVLRNNLPLFLEKPIATSFEDATRLWHAYQQSGKPQVVVSFPLRLTCLAQKAKEILDSGRLGKIGQVQCINNVPYGPRYYQRWYRDESITGGLFLQKTTHDLDAVNFLINKRAVEVCAMTSKIIYRGNHPAGLQCSDCPDASTCPESPAYLKRFVSEIRPTEDCSFGVDTGNEDTGSVLVRYEDGVHCSYTQNFYARKKAAMRLYRVLCYRGTLEFDFYTGQVKVFMHDDGSVETYDYNGMSTIGHWNGDKMLTETFLNCIKGGTSASPLRAGMESDLICLAARQSAQEKRFVAVPSVDEL